jgi:hypothetical protein
MSSIERTLFRLSTAPRLVAQRKQVGLTQRPGRPAEEQGIIKYEAERWSSKRRASG